MEGFGERLACKGGRLFERNPRLYVAGKQIPNKSLLACVFLQWSFTTKSSVPWPYSLRMAKDLSLHEDFEERDWLAMKVAMRRQIAKQFVGLRRPQRQLFEKPRSVVSFYMNPFEIFGLNNLFVVLIRARRTRQGKSNAREDENRCFRANWAKPWELERKGFPGRSWSLHSIDDYFSLTSTIRLSRPFPPQQCSEQQVPLRIYMVDGDEYRGWLTEPPQGSLFIAYSFPLVRILGPTTVTRTPRHVQSNVLGSSVQRLHLLISPVHRLRTARFLVFIWHLARLIQASVCKSCSTQLVMHGLNQLPRLALDSFG